MGLSMDQTEERDEIFPTRYYLKYVSLPSWGLKTTQVIPFIGMFSIFLIFMLLILICQTNIIISLNVFTNKGYCIGMYFFPDVLKGGSDGEIYFG